MSSTTLDNIAAYVTAIQADEKLVDTSFKESAILSTLMGKKRVKGGALLNYGVKNGSQVSNAKMFLPESTGDFVGVAGSTNVYQTVDAVAQVQFAWGFHASNLSYNDVMFQMAKTGGKSQLNDYLGSKYIFTAGKAVENIGYQLVSGTGSGTQSTIATGGTGPSASTAVDISGLRYQDRIFSGTPNGNANSPATNVQFNLARHLHAELVSNYFDATAHYGTTVTIEGATLTASSTVVSVATNLDYTPYIGWEIWVCLAGDNGTYTRLGREYVVADASTSATTTFQMAQVYRGDTDTDVDIQLRAPFTVTKDGPAGELTMGKILKPYYSASQGSQMPDLGFCNVRTFAALKSYLWSIAKVWPMENADMRGKGYKNFEVEGATMVIDDNMPDGEIHFINTNWTRMYTLEGMDTWKITGADIMELPASTGHQIYGCNKVFPFQVVSESPRSNARLVNFAV